MHSLHMWSGEHTTPEAFLNALSPPVGGDQFCAQCALCDVSAHCGLYI
jgi:hypothetical protein